MRFVPTYGKKTSVHNADWMKTNSQTKIKFEKKSVHGKENYSHKLY